MVFKGFSLKRLQRAALWLSLGLVVAIPLAMLVGGSQPQAAGLIPVPWDKPAHMAVYAVLSCAIGFASRQRGGWAIAIGFGGAVLVGALDEWNQMRLVGRSADIDDLVADAVGAALGTTVLAVRVYLRQWAAQHTDDQ
jgi:VanZ family protein